MSEGKIRDALKGQVKPRGGAHPAAPKPKAEPILAPTEEQAAKADYHRTEIRDEGRYVGFAYRRRPLIESLADKIGLGPAEMSALRYYRTVYERADASPAKSCLDIGAGGGGGNGTESRALTAIEREVAAKEAVRRCEAAAGAVADTLRAVAVFDQSFSDVAMARFGSRNQHRIEDGVHRDKAVPRSGRHREIIADEFRQGTRALVRMLAGYRLVAGTGDVSLPDAQAPERKTVSAAIMTAVLSNPAAAGIWIAEATLHDLARESGTSDPQIGGMEMFAGIPLLLREGWVWGWTLLAAQEESCAGATEVA